MSNRITPSQFAAAYEVARSVRAGSMTKAAGIQKLGAEAGLNLNSARDFINDYAHMLRGEGFQRAMSAPAMEYFLEGILRDHGPITLAKAIKGVRSHIVYYESLGRGKLEKMRSVVDSFANRITIKIDLAEEAADFTRRVTSSLLSGSDDRLARLAKAPKYPIQVIAMGTVFLRNPDVVAEVLARAAGVCEGCLKPAPFNRKRDGTPYLEVHHKTQLAHGGEDTVENALALCPNCHRRSHYGEA